MQDNFAGFSALASQAQPMFAVPIELDSNQFGADQLAGTQLRPMTSPSSSPPNDNHRTISQHGFTVALIIAVWVPGQTIGWFEKGAPRDDSLCLHHA